MEGHAHETTGLSIPRTPLKIFKPINIHVLCTYLVALWAKILPFWPPAASPPPFERGPPPPLLGTLLQSGTQNGARRVSEGVLEAILHTNSEN